MRATQLLRFLLVFLYSNFLRFSALLAVCLGLTVHKENNEGEEEEETKM